MTQPKSKQPPALLRQAAIDLMQAANYWEAAKYRECNRNLLTAVQVEAVVSEKLDVKLAKSSKSSKSGKSSKSAKRKK